MKRTCLGPQRAEIAQVVGSAVARSDFHQHHVIDRRHEHFESAVDERGAARRSIEGQWPPRPSAVVQPVWLQAMALGDDSCGITGLVVEDADHIDIGGHFANGTVGNEGSPCTVEAGRCGRQCIEALDCDLETAGRAGSVQADSEALLGSLNIGERHSRFVEE